MTIKIQCGCGQRYAFDAEPVNGRIASPVACPACGADGTAAANATIAQTTPPPPTVAALRLRASTPAPSNQPSLSASAPPQAALLPGQLEPAQAEAEAKAKIFWGDPHEDVVKFLMMHGFSHDNASASVHAMFQERTAGLRGIGMRKIVTGIALMAVPVVSYLIFAHYGVIILKLFAIAIMVGLWGAWIFFKGLIMVWIPESNTGDIADQ